VVKKAKTLPAKEKTAEFKSQRERDQLSATLENEGHCGHTRAISSIASWKEGFVDESHMYKKHKTHEITHNTEETFALQFFNFMRKTPQYVVQMHIPQINLNLGATIQLFASSSADSAPNRDMEKYHVDGIKDPTPYTLMYVKAGHQGLLKLSKLL
jgi:hypothetical protein